MVGVHIKDGFNKKKSSEHVHIECKQKEIKLPWLKWFSKAQNQCSTKDLLITFLQDKLHISAAFYLSGNTFKRKPNQTTSRVHTAASSPSTYSHRLLSKSFLFVLKGERGIHSLHILKYKKLSQLLL